MEKDSFVYCWTDNATGKLYVGSHKGHVDDGYICSSKVMLLEYKARPKDFTREIIAEGTHKDIRQLEGIILSAVNAAKDPNFYNLNNQNGKFCLSEEHWKKLSVKLKGDGNGMFGKTHCEEVKKKLSELAKTRTAGKNPNARKVFTPHGVFNSLLDASKNLDMTYDQIRYRVNPKRVDFPDWGYIK
jgi:hypothetical protein